MRKAFIPIGLLVSCSSLLAADFTPIPLNPSSFNADPVIEKGAPPTINDYITVTPDQGTNKNGNTVYETGYNTSNSSGIPVHNSIVTDPSGTHSFQMPPDYHTNNVLFFGHGMGTWTPVLGPATFTLTTPAAFSSLSVLSGSGNGPVLVQYTVHHGDGSTEQGTFSSVDWWDGSAGNKANKVFDPNGLISLNGGVNNQSTNHGSAFFADINLQNTASPVTSVDFAYYGNGAGQNPYSNGRTFIYALSGSTDGTTFNPIAVTGYNQKGILAADAPPTFGSAPGSVLTNDNTYCSFTMDGGIYKSGNTWFEQGYYADIPSCGIPAAGSTITSATEPSIHYTMPSTYVGNCAVCLSSNVPTAQITFATPASYGAISLLGSGGNNGTRLPIGVVVQFQGGASETNWIFMADWFDRTDPYAWISFGRVNPTSRAFNNTPDEFADVFASAPNPPVVATDLPFVRDPRLGGQQNPNIPPVRLFDFVVPLTNSTTPITGIMLVTTNAGMWNNTASFFAVSGSAGAPPVITQPASYVIDSTTGNTNATTGPAVANDIRITKGYQGLDNITLWVSNMVGSAVTYQWKKAPRGGGWRDIYDSYDMSTFANVTDGGNISGSTTSSLTISNATLNDSGDYIVVASNPYGMMTSFVATVSVLTTNSSLLVGEALGDVITLWSADGTSSGAENFTHAIDQQEQKWLSTGLGGVGYGGMTIPQGTVPFVGPIGYIVIPVNGASIVNSIRFYCANDTPGRDPADYLLEGSNDGASWSTITGGQLIGTLMLPVARGGTGSTPVNPMTEPLTEVDFANSTPYKQYRVTITNNIEPTATSLMQVGEIQLLGTFQPNPPVWVRQPVPAVTVYAGTSPTWGVVAGGYPAPKFQWYRGGTAIPNATNSTYTLDNAQLSDSGASFYCVASNSGGQLTSSSSTLTVVAAPTQTYPTAVLADKPMGYWRLDEGPDNGSGNSGTITHDYAGGHNGYYTNVTLAVPGYNPTSDPDTATLFAPGGLAADSAVANINDVDFARGTNTAGATFSVEAWVNGPAQLANSAILAKGNDGALAAGTGTGTEQYALDIAGSPLGFRFLVRDFFGNGHVAQSKIAPSTDPVTLQTPWHHVVGVCDQPNGQLYLYVDGLLAATGTIPTNMGILSQPMATTIGARQSTPASDLNEQFVGTIDDVAIYPTALNAGQVLNHYFGGQLPPIITMQPTNTTSAENVPVTFYSGAYGSGGVSYQWYQSNGSTPTTALPGQTFSNLTFTTSASQNQNYYQLVVTNAYGSATGAVAQLTVVSGAPSFLADLPASQTVNVGHVIQLHVWAGGTAPFTYQWQKNGTNIVNDYRTSGAQTDTLTIGYAQTTDSGNYQVVVSNGQGTTPSTMDAVSVVMGTPNYFSENSADWTLQGTTMPVFNNASIQLSASLGSTARSAFMTTKKNIANFNASYIYQDTTGTGGADGVSFCIQNQSATALGGAGGSIGYAGITPSVALAFNIYAPNTKGIELVQNGATPTAPYTPILPVDLGNNTDQVRVDLQYGSGVLKATFTDLTTLATFNTSFNVDIPTIVGGNTAWVGFTGGDGGVSSTQLIFVNVSSGQTPFPLNAQHVGNSLVLSWSTTMGGAILQSSPSLENPNWTTATAPFSLVGNQAQVTVSPLTGNLFYRLQIYP